jgi:hypothetical protein
MVGLFAACCALAAIGHAAAAPPIALMKSRRLMNPSGEWQKPTTSSSAAMSFCITAKLIGG